MIYLYLNKHLIKDSAKDQAADAVKPALTALNLLRWWEVHRNKPCAAVEARGAVLQSQA